MGPPRCGRLVFFCCTAAMVWNDLYPTKASSARMCYDLYSVHFTTLQEYMFCLLCFMYRSAYLVYMVVHRLCYATTCTTTKFSFIGMTHSSMDQWHHYHFLHLPPLLCWLVNIHSSAHWMVVSLSLQMWLSALPMPQWFTSLQMELLSMYVYVRHMYASA